ncbi:hypothetical protein [Actinomadura madurae]|uniref:hypothetical protein n=1 Tax=Actinomadura madurae TaxID=1993 RepID=UPI0020D22FC1|nr:hypothetical protein [Actinomadura madurae]MCP9965235.1 hypothetical protein [Actinomadura madurae]MCQ0013910.1 hypothetical protein [Actinomadura madurae]
MTARNAMASRTTPTRPSPPDGPAPASLAYMTVQRAAFSARSWRRQWPVNRDQLFATALPGGSARRPDPAAASSRAVSRRNAS